MKTLQKLAKIALAIGAVGALLSSCSTMQGFGNDVERAGNAIERGASH